jgi:hypothetical protein
MEARYAEPAPDRAEARSPYVATVMPGIPDYDLQRTGLTIEPISPAAGQVVISKQQAETTAVKNSSIGGPKVIASMLARVSSSHPVPRVNCVCWVVSFDPGGPEVIFYYVVLNASDGKFVFGSSQGGT